MGDAAGTDDQASEWMSFSALLDVGDQDPPPSAPAVPQVPVASAAPVAPVAPVAPAPRPSKNPFPVRAARPPAAAIDATTPTAPALPMTAPPAPAAPAPQPTSAGNSSFPPPLPPVRIGAPPGAGAPPADFSARSEWSPAPASPAARSQRSSLQQLVAAVVVVVLVLGIGSAVLVSRSAGSKYPSKWDARIAPIATEVSALRGLTFEHPVSVHFLAPTDFEKTLAIDQGALDDDARQQVEQAAAEMRAVGLIGGDVDVLDAYDQAQTSGTLAYYDPTKKEIYVRGETLDVAHRVTLAHELTHVLQDQRFDLQHLREQAAATPNADPDALDAIVEGDAVRIQDDYLAQLSDTEQQQYEQQNGAELDRYTQASGSLPEIFSLQMGAPYVYGPYTIRVRLADDGNAAIDRALNGRPLSTRMYVEPGNIDAPAATDDPQIPAAAEALGDASNFSAFDAFVMLGARVDAYVALRAADAVAGGRAQTYRRADGKVCVQATLATPGALGHGALLNGLNSWATGLPGTVVADGDGSVAFTSCDPGTAAATPAPEAITAAEQLLALRGELTAEIAEQGADEDAAALFGALARARPGPGERAARGRRHAHTRVAAATRRHVRSKCERVRGRSEHRPERLKGRGRAAEQSTTWHSLFRAMTLWGTARCGATPLATSRVGRLAGWWRANATEALHMYIGLGTLVVILIIVLIIYFVRRA